MPRTAPSAPCETWTPSEVAQWLKSRSVSKKLSRHAAAFKKAEVTGAQLVQLTPAELAGLGVTDATAQEQLLDAVVELRHHHRRGTLHQFGGGSEHHAAGMTHMAELLGSLGRRPSLSDGAGPAADCVQADAEAATAPLPPPPPSAPPAADAAAEPRAVSSEPESPYAVLHHTGRKHRPTAAQLPALKPRPRPSAAKRLFRGETGGDADGDYFVPAQLPQPAEPELDDADAPLPPPPPAPNAAKQQQQQQQAMGLVGRYSKSRRHVQIFDAETGERVMPADIAEHQRQLKQRTAGNKRMSA